MAKCNWRTLFHRLVSNQPQQHLHGTMTPTRPNISYTGSYTVTQASELLGISRRTLRRYESSGLVVAHLNKLGRRKYSGRELIKLWNMNY